MNFTIEIKALKIDAIIGCYEYEKLRKTTLSIDADIVYFIDCPEDHVIKSENIIDYTLLCTAIKNVFDSGNFDFLENALLAVMNCIMSYKAVISCNARLTKIFVVRGIERISVASSVSR